MQVKPAANRCVTICVQDERWDELKILKIHFSSLNANSGKSKKNVWLFILVRWILICIAQRWFKQIATNQQTHTHTQKKQTKKQKKKKKETGKKERQKRTEFSLPETEQIVMADSSTHTHLQDRTRFNIKAKFAAKTRKEHNQPNFCTCIYTLCGKNGTVVGAA